MLEWNTQKDHVLEGRIDPTRIGALGVSLGGLTTTLLVEDPMRRDPREQQRITLIAVSAFFQSHFAQDSAARSQSDEYLRTEMANELSGVTVAISPR